MKHDIRELQAGCCYERAQEHGRMLPTDLGLSRAGFHRGSKPDSNLMNVVPVRCPIVVMVEIQLERTDVSEVVH